MGISWRPAAACDEWDRFAVTCDGAVQEQLAAFAGSRWPYVGLESLIFRSDGRPVGGALAGGPILLTLFGSGFEAERWPLVILCLALVVRSFFGPAVLVLSLNNQPWAAMPAIAAGLMSLLAANMWLVPLIGVTGVALAALISISVWGLARWHKARSVSGLDVSLLARAGTHRAAAIK